MNHQCSFCGEAPEAAFLYCSAMPYDGNVRETCICARCAEFAGKTLAGLQNQPRHLGYIHHAGGNPYLKPKDDAK